MKDELKARLILLWPCGRRCKLCCNRYSNIMAKVTSVESLKRFQNYDEVMLTGGEPLFLSGDKLELIARQLKEIGVKRLFCYTTYWNKNGEQLLPYLDGIHFSIHDDYSIKDLETLKVIENLAKQHRDKSFRLYIDPAVKLPVIIDARFWKRVECKPFMDETELLNLQENGVPKDEELFVYLPTAKSPMAPKIPIVIKVD